MVPRFGLVVGGIDKGRARAKACSQGVEASGERSRYGYRQLDRVCRMVTRSPTTRFVQAGHAA